MECLLTDRFRQCWITAAQARRVAWVFEHDRNRVRTHHPSCVVAAGNSGTVTHFASHPALVVSLVNHVLAAR